MCTYYEPELPLPNLSPGFLSHLDLAHPSLARSLGLHTVLAARLVTEVSRRPARRAAAGTAFVEGIKSQAGWLLQ